MRPWSWIRASPLLLALGLASCDRGPTALVAEVQAHPEIHFLELRGETPNGDLAFPVAGVVLPENEPSGSIVVLLEPSEPWSIVVVARGLDAGRAASAEASSPVTIIPGEVTRTRLTLGAPSICPEAGCAQCGDGLIEGDEACDDGNERAGDGCGAACELEAGYDCAGEPSSCRRTWTPTSEAPPDLGLRAERPIDPLTRVPEPPPEDDPPPEEDPPPPEPVCGDGLIEGNEACDDGNERAGDGCSPTCRVEAGYICSGAPSVCERDCSAPCRGACPVSGCCTSRCMREPCNMRCPRGCDCHFDCAGADECEVRCDRATRCEIDCAGADECEEITCRRGAACLLYCAGADDCEFDECEGPARRCAGATLACNRACP